MIAVNHMFMCMPAITAAGGTQAPVTSGLTPAAGTWTPITHMHVQNRAPHPGKQLEMEFSTKASVLISQLFMYSWPSLAFCFSVFPCLFLPK